MADNNDNNHAASSSTATHATTPSKFERFIGILFAFLVLALIAYTIVMETKIDDNKMLLLYILISIMAGAVVATIPGFLNIDYSGKGMSLRAAGGIAAFVLVLSVLQELHTPNKPQNQPGNDINGNNTNINNSNTNTGSLNNQQIQTIQQTFRATAYCSMTGASGYGVSINVVDAQNIAIQYCVASGGIPDCCGGNVRVEQF